MFDYATFSVFLATAIIILVIPGPAVLYVVARSVEQGRVAGVVSVAGISLATMVHALAGTLGLSAILMSSSLAFSVVKYIGAAYLIYIGIRIILTKQDIRVHTTSRKRTLMRLFTEGFIVNLFNPKTALFFFAFLPQFIRPDSGFSVPVQFFVLGCVMALLGLVSDGIWALFAGSVARWLKSSEHALNIQRWLSGSILVGLGITTALTEPSMVKP